MQYRKMGNLGWEVSALGFGAMRFPLLGSWTEIDTVQAEKMLMCAIDNGVNYLDTAWRYHDGESEKFIGKVLTPELRKKIKLVTKSPIWLIETKEDFYDYYNQQLERLNTDYLDIYLFHAVNRARWDKIKNLGLINEMEKLKSEGKIKHFGFSFHGSPDVFTEIIDAYNWDVTQIQFNYLDTEFQATVRGLDHAYSKGIAVVIMEPLRGGKLAQYDAEIDAIVQNAPVKKELVEWALHFIMNHPGVSTILSGMSAIEQVKDNIKYINSYNTRGLEDQELAVIEQLATAYKKKIKVSCTSCQYCVPCPEGVEIPENLFLLNQAVWEGKTRGWMHKWYKELESDDPTTFWHGKGAANRCTSCGECLDKCPQSIAIPTEMDLVRKIFEEGLEIDKIDTY